VTNPYSGPHGYAQVFAKQKGYSELEVEQQMREARIFREKLKEATGIDLNAYPGTGAAGGLGGAIVALGGTLQSGFEILADYLAFKEFAASTDYIFTGEGNMDAQSADGKLISRVAAIGKEFNKPVIALNGGRSYDIGTLEDTLLASFSIMQKPMSISDAMKSEVAEKNLETLSFEIGKLLFKK
jgi:glycerate kinase